VNASRVDSDGLATSGAGLRCRASQPAHAEQQERARHLHPHPRARHALDPKSACQGRRQQCPRNLWLGAGRAWTMPPLSRALARKRRPPASTEMSARLSARTQQCNQPDAVDSQSPAYIVDAEYSTRVVVVEAWREGARAAGHLCVLWTAEFPAPQVFRVAAPPLCPHDDPSRVVASSIHSNTRHVSGTPSRSRGSVPSLRFVAEFRPKVEDGRREGG